MSDSVLLLVSILLFFASAFFVAAEYAIVSARKEKLEPAAKKGSPLDRLAIKALESQSRYVAGTQVCITFLGIAIGAVLEPALTAKLETFFPDVIPDWAVSMVSILVVSYPLVVIGELVPKYVTLQFPEAILRFVIGPMRILVVFLKPIIWLFEKSGVLVMKLLRVKVSDDSPVISREELYYLIRAGQEGGGLQEDQAEFVSKTLRLDELDAEDAMLHRLDIKWLDANLTKEQVLEKLTDIPHSRIPVCRGDIDDVVGIVYLHDIVVNLGDASFDLVKLAREPIYVPESLTLNRLVEIMRDHKSQIAIVQDEYGGTRGLVTLEDIIEEVFGDLEDTKESERPTIERTSAGRVSARGDVRYDELLDFLDLEPDESEFTTESLAEVLMNSLGRTAKIGDTVDLPVGRLRVEQLAQRRITRVGVYLRSDVVSAQEEAPAKR